MKNRINEKKLRLLIRRHLLKENEDGIIYQDATSADEIVEKDKVTKNGKTYVYNAKATEAAKQKLLDQAKKFEKGPDLLMTPAEARTQAVAMYEALEGGYDFGLGTDDEGVEGVINSVVRNGGSALDLSQIAHEYRLHTKTNFTGDNSLLEALIDDYKPNDDYYLDNVVYPIASESFPLLKFDGKDYSESEFIQLLDENEDTAKKTMEDVNAKYDERLGAYDGTDFMAAFADGATGVLAIGVAASAASVVYTGGLSALAGAAISLSPMGWLAMAVGGTAIAGYRYFFGQSAEQIKDEYRISNKHAAALTPYMFLLMTDGFKKRAKELRNEAAGVKVYTELEEEEIDEDIMGDGGRLPPDVDGLADSEQEIYRRIQVIMNEYCKRAGINKSVVANGVWDGRSVAMWKNHFIKSVFQDHPVFSTTSIAPEVIAGRTYSWIAISNALSGTYPGYTLGPRGCLAFCLDAYYGNTDYGETAPGSGGFFEEPDPVIDDEDDIGGGQAQTDPRPDVVAPVVIPDDNQQKRVPRDVSGSGSGIRKAEDIFIGVDFDNASVNSGVAGISDETRRNTARNRLIDATDLKGVFRELNRVLQIRLVGDMKGKKFTGGRGNLVQNQENFVVRVRQPRFGGDGVRVDRIKGNAGQIFRDMRRTIRDCLEDESVIQPGLLPIFYDCTMDIVVPRGYYEKTSGREQEAEESVDIRLNENSEIRRMIKNAIVKNYING